MPLGGAGGWGARQPPAAASLLPGHPLTRGLAGLWLFNEGGGALLRNLVTGRAAAVANGTWAPGASGAALQCNGTSTNAQATDLPGFGAPLSVLVDVRFDPIFNEQMLVEREAVNATWLLMIYQGAVRWRGASATDRVVSADLASGGAVAGEWHTIGVTDDGTTAQLYRDGVFVTNGSTGSPPAATASTIHFGNYDNTAFWLAARLGRVALYQRVLAPAEMARLALRAEPYAMLAPPAPRLRAGGGVVAPAPQTTARWTPRGRSYSWVRG